MRNPSSQKTSRAQTTPQQHNFFAVLTGDIIQSRELSSRDLDAVRAALHNAVGGVKKWQPGLIHEKAEFFRGDSWQLLIKDPARSLRIGIYLRAALLANAQADSRLSIGLGTVENIVPRRRVTLSTGEAFYLSGAGLDAMTRYAAMTIEAPASILSQWLRVVAHLCDALISKWTERQAQVICMAIAPADPTHEEISKMLTPAVSKQAVTKTLNAANWHVVRETIHQFEETQWESVLNSRPHDNP